MNKIILFLFMACFQVFLTAQEKWNIQLSESSITAAGPSAFFVQQQGSGYLMAYNRGMYNVTKNGKLDQFYQIPFQGGSALGAFVQPMVDPLSGHSFFISGYANVPSVNQPYKIVQYRPGVGSEAVYSMPSSNAVLSNYKGPAVVVLNESTYVIFSKDGARKIQYQAPNSIQLLWESTYSLRKTIAAAYGNGRFLTITTDGQAVVMDEMGQTVWSKEFAGKFASVARMPDGWLLCGRTSVDEVGVVRIDEDGNILWEPSFNELGFNHVMVGADGFIYASGQTKTLDILLQKMDVTGNIVYRRTFQKGQGYAMLSTQDGGVLLTAADAGRCYLIKTDGIGSAPLVASEERLQKKEISNGVVKGSFIQDNFVAAGNFIPFLSSTLVGDSMDITGFVARQYIGGKTENGEFRTAQQGLVETGFRNGFVEGPAKDFNRVWVLSKEEIDQFRADFAAGASPSNVPKDILEWPARNNPNFKYNPDFSPVTTPGSALPAPFVDVNGDGNYNAFDGDFPEIKGDFMAWWIATDSTQATGDFKPMYVDMAFSAYLYACSDANLISKTVFLETTIRNRSNLSYLDSTYSTLYLDPDLGCYLDDYIGTIPELASVIVYDGDPSFPGCSLLPRMVHSATNLEHSLSSAMYTVGTNANIGTEEPITGEEVFNTMKGFWRDGEAVTDGGSGRGGTTPVRFVFPDSPSDLNGWSMCTANLAFADRRLLMNSEAFSFLPDQIIRNTTAFVFHPIVTDICPDINADIKPAIATIREQFQSGAFGKPLLLPAQVQLSVGQTVTLNATLQGATGYQWSTGQTSSSINVSMPGEYRVTITRINGCTTEEVVYVRFQNSPVSSPTTGSEWSVSPNPSNDWVVIQAQEGSAVSAAQLRVSDAQGRIVSEQKIYDGYSRISLQNYPSGVYFFTVVASDGRAWRGKVVRN